MNKRLSNIVDKIRDLTPTLKKQYGVKDIELFGSYVHGVSNSKSDLDVLVTFSRTPGLIKFITLKNFLSDRIGIEVDLVMKESLKPQLKKYIVNNTLSV